MAYLCNSVEQQPPVSQKKLDTSSAVLASEDLQYGRKNVEYVQKGLSSLLGQFLASDCENSQLTTHKYTQNSGTQYCERNVTSTESKSKNEDLSLASLLGYPIVRTKFENRNNRASENTSTCRSRHGRVQQSVSGVEMHIGTNPAYLKINNDCANTNQTSYVHGTPSSGKIDSTSRLFDGHAAVNYSESLRKGEGSGIVYENCEESDDENDTPWWLNSEHVHMGDVHRAVNEFLSGTNTGHGLQTQKIKEEFMMNDSNSVETNNWESSDILDSAFKAVVDIDYSRADNESCTIQNNHRENVPTFVPSDDANILSKGNETCRRTLNVATSWGHIWRGTPLSVSIKGGNNDNGSMYACNVCDKVFSNLGTVQDHVRVHLGIRPYSCSRADCVATFTSVDRLNLHMRIGHSGTSDTTSRPSVIYSTDAVTHVSVLNADKIHKKPSNEILEVFPCSKCDKDFTDSNLLLEHTMSHSRIKSRECQSCGERFPTYYARRKHWRDINSSCYKLESTGKQRSDIRRPNPVKTNSHANQRNVSGFSKKMMKKKRYQCKECDQKFNKERRIADHVCFGTGADLYTCDTCSKAFVQRSALIRHFKNHSVA